MLLPSFGQHFDKMARYDIEMLQMPKTRHKAVTSPDECCLQFWHPV